MKKFEIIPHTADLKIKVFGKTINEIFAHAFLALFDASQAIPISDKKNNYEIRAFEISAPDYEQLLVDFLNKVLLLSDTNNEMYLDTSTIKIAKHTVSAELHAIPIKKYEGSEIKAVTYHDLVLQQTKEGWIAEFVCDI